jgi:hypothetical protein
VGGLIGIELGGLVTVGDSTGIELEGSVTEELDVGKQGGLKLIPCRSLSSLSSMANISMSPPSIQLSIPSNIT